MLPGSKGGTERAIRLCALRCGDGAGAIARILAPKQPELFGIDFPPGSRRGAWTANSRGRPAVGRRERPSPRWTFSRRRSRASARLRPRSLAAPVRQALADFRRARGQDTRGGGGGGSGEAVEDLGGAQGLGSGGVGANADAAATSNDDGRDRSKDAAEGARGDNAKDVASAANDAGAPLDPDIAALEPDDAVRRLRRLGQPATLFGETHLDRLARLHHTQTQLAHAMAQEEHGATGAQANEKQAELRAPRSSPRGRGRKAPPRRSSPPRRRPPRRRPPWPASWRGCRRGCRGGCRR